MKTPVFPLKFSGDGATLKVDKIVSMEGKIWSFLNIRIKWWMALLIFLLFSALIMLLEILIA